MNFNHSTKEECFAVTPSSSPNNSWDQQRICKGYPQMSDAYALVRFSDKKHLFRVRKVSCFGKKYILSPKTWLEIILMCSKKKIQQFHTYKHWNTVLNWGYWLGSILACNFTSTSICRVINMQCGCEMTHETEISVWVIQMWTRRWFADTLTANFLKF